MNQEVICAGKVVLRPKRLEDAQDDYAWRVDEELAALDAALPLRQSYEDFLRLYEGELRYPSPWSRRFAIDTPEGKHIGNCMCYDINPSYREAELGIMIGDRDYWSRSYGYDSMVALVDLMFREVSLRRLYLHTLEGNIRARKCFEKCGFTLRRMVRRDGKSFALMELFRDRWNETREEKIPWLGATTQDSVSVS